MDNDKIEQVLRENYPAPDAASARGRILEHAARELRPVRSGLCSGIRWAVTAAVAATILLANISDHARQIRLTGGRDGTPALSAAAIAERQRLACDLFAQDSLGGDKYGRERLQ